MTTKDELDAIFARNGSDKHAHAYAGPYAEHLGYLREAHVKLLEIGVGGYADALVGGHSLRAWKEFFPNASISALDYFDKAALCEDRIQIYQGSQDDAVAIARIISSNIGGFDIVIDDGSHRNDHVLATLIMLWPHVAEEGWYIIEDLQTSYWPNHAGRMHDVNSPLTSMGFLKSLIDGLNWKERHQPTYQPSLMEATIVGIHFYHNMCFLKKGRNDKPSTEVINNRINGV